MTLTVQELDLVHEYEADWNKYAAEVLAVNLDQQEQELLYLVEHNRRVSGRSGHARGKDYVAAVASTCFLYLNYPSKVIMTAPTGRQVEAIMMAEIKKIHKNAIYPLGGRLLSDGIKFEDDPDWFLMGFKAADKTTEAWTGFHSPNIMVVVTEATGILDVTFDAIEGILTGNSKLFIVYNPNQLSGEAYRSSKSPLYKTMKLSCLDAPNVIAKETVIPGQVDWLWIDEKIKKPGWVVEIDEEEVDKTKYDFQWEGRWYRPNDLFRVKVLGEFPAESEDALIPLSWVEAANERWEERSLNGDKLRLGADIAGMGVDLTVFTHRYDDYVQKIEVFTKQDHMITAGKIKIRLKNGGFAFIDTIGEGAGVFSRLHEQKANVVSVKGSESAKGLSDITGEREFANMRAYTHWAVRDALDPEHGATLALPPIDELTQDLTEIRWLVRSKGDIIIEPKEDIKERLGRSPDYSDSLCASYRPMNLVFPNL